MRIRKSFRTLALSLGLIVVLYALGAAISLTGQRPINKQTATVGVPGVLLTIVNSAAPNAKPASSATADAHGAFDMGVLPPGTYSLIVNPPPATSAQAKSFFESRSNMRVEIMIKEPRKTSAANLLVVDFDLKDGTLIRSKADHNMSKSIIQNIKAREAMGKDNELIVVVGKGQSVSGRITSIAEKPPGK